VYRWIISVLLIAVLAPLVLLARVLVYRVLDHGREVRDRQRRADQAPSVAHLTEDQAIRAAAQWCSENLTPTPSRGGEITAETREIFRWALVRATAGQMRDRMLEPNSGAMVAGGKLVLDPLSPAFLQALAEAGLTDFEAEIRARYIGISGRHATVFFADGHLTIWNAPGRDWDAEMLEFEHERAKDRPRRGTAAREGSENAP
jgi:hypothetical protein